jgi:uncharacterized protein involved in exopolysaccharide biosynthesis/Mrp family chromosome partitioning ATPase
MYNYDPNSLPSAMPLTRTPEGVPVGSDQGLGLHEILDTLWRRRVFVAKVTAGMLLLAVLFVLLVPPRFTATAQLTVDPRGLQVMDNEVTPRGGSTPDVNAAVVETHTRILVSDSVLRRVVESERLDADPDFNGLSEGIVGELRRIAKHLLGRLPLSPQMQALQVLQDSVRARATKDSYVISLSVTTTEPQKSARLAQAIIDAYQQVLAVNRKDVAGRTSGALAARLEQLKERVATAEAKVQSFKAETNIIGANGQLVHEQQLSDLSNQLTAARVRSAELRARYEQMERLAKTGAVPDTSSDAMRSPVIAQLRGRYAEVKQLEDDYRINLGERHPLLISARTQVDSLRRQIVEELKRVAAVARTDYEQALSSERDLIQKMESLVSNAASLNQHIVQLRELEREAQASRAVYESFLNRTREVREQQDIDSTNTTVITPAIPPSKPNGLPPILLVIVAGAVGLNLGGLAAVARERFGGAYRLPDPAPRLVEPSSLPVLAVLPQPRLDAISGGTQGDGGGTSLIVDFPPESHATGVSRAIYQLYDKLCEGRPKGSPNVVLVMSADDSVGKSCVALSLALAAGRRGEAALLVDGDPAAVLSHSIGRPTALGFQDVLNRYVPPDAAIQKLTPTNVAMLTNRTTDKARLELTGKAVIQMLIEPLSQLDLIVIDGGIAGNNPNGRALASAATGVIVVVQDRTRRADAIDRLQHALGAEAAKVVGAVVMKSSDADMRARRPAWKL